LEQEGDALKWRMFGYPMVFDFTRRSVGHSESPCLPLLTGASGRHDSEGDLTLDKSLPQSKVASLSMRANSKT
jgi:hypothetical protein